MKKIFMMLLVFVLSLPICSIGSAFSPQSNTVTPPKNVILMVGDGMGVGQLEVASLFEHGKEGKLFLESLPQVALARTFSNNNSVTDSAAGGTALATGIKTNNGMLGVSPDGTEVDSILDLFKQHGKKVGVISTHMVVDATPAAFTSSVKNRWDGQPEIARQQLKNEVDVILGGGSHFFQPEQQGGVDLIKKYQEKGYTYVRNRSELKKYEGDKLLGLFHPSYMSFKLDRDDLESEEPNLIEMTKKAIEVLSKEDKGFFLMVEGARIDHASHATDLTSIWKETIEFDDTVKYVVNWANRDQETLVVVVADHETMGITLTEKLNVEALKKIGVSTTFIASQLKKKNHSEEYTTKSVRQAFKNFAHIELTDQQIHSFNQDIIRARGKVYSAFQTEWHIGSTISNYYHGGAINLENRTLGNTGGHSANMVPVFAYGKGASIFNGVINNTDIPKNIAHLMGYEMYRE
ncbi:alkaline phosphatase [Cytobacillus sp. FJAT-54145]|uniref:Alkaline phosphatase n=1 Tax=Cytobacillus spartinae TaxID=3299023 RepID=A0ABW6KE42_9BACI